MSCFLVVSQISPGQYSAFSLYHQPYIKHPIQIPRADSRNKNNKQSRQDTAVITLCELTMMSRKNMTDTNPKPIFHANFFWAAPTYSGACLFTIKRPSINEGENFGLMNRRMRKSVRKMIIKYLSSKKFLSKCTIIMA